VFKAERELFILLSRSVYLEKTAEEQLNYTIKRKTGWVVQYANRRQISAVN
jgi:hypothetical protein